MAVQPFPFHLNLEVKSTHTCTLLQYIREMYRYLFCFCSITVFSLRLGNSGDSTFLELRNRCRLAAVLETEGLCLGNRPGKQPVLIQLLVIDKLATLQSNGAVINTHNHTLTTFRAIHIGHLIDGAQVTVVLIGVLTRGHRI